MHSSLAPPGGYRQPRSRAASGTSTPIPHQSLTALQVPKHDHPDSLGGWLRNIMDKPKYAIFEAKVVIEELGNVPQLEGRFEAAWKFRGRKPNGKDAGTLTPQPSLPNLRTQQTPSILSRSFDGASTPSLNSSISSGASTPVTQTSQSPQKPRKTTSLSTLAMTPGNGGPSQQTSPSSIKRSTEPTPLRQSTGPIITSGSIFTEMLDSPTASPESLEPPALPNAGAGERNSQDGGGSQSSTRSSPAASKRNLSGTGPYPLSINTQIAPSFPSRGPSTSSTNRSTSSGGSMLVPRSVSSLVPPTRSGSSPSPETLLDPLPGRQDLTLRPPAIIRTGSSGSLTRSASYKDVTKLGKPGLRRAGSRIFSGHSTPGPWSDPMTSTERKGTTPVRDLRQHTCEWQYTVTQTIRIPMGKTVAASGAATPGRREQAPILGGGPLSESGFSLDIYEIRTPSTLATDHPNGMNDDPASMLHGVHVAKRHPERNASDPKERRERTERVLYGSVDIDLAPFAGKSRMGRRFLLKGSRTNATVRVTVEMKLVGGETYWAAPPMQEGHHVTGIRDLVGDEPDKPHDPLKLERNSSNSSSGSSISGPTTAASRSATSLGLLHGPSAVSLQPAQKSDYKSYDHHLKPSDARRKDNTNSPSHSDSSPISPDSPGAHTPISPESPGATPRKSDGFFGSPFHRRKTVHHHHSLHIKHHNTNDHRAHGHHHSVLGVHELSPETIIEAIFNPRPAAEEGPMTYVPHDMYGRSASSATSLGLQPEAEVLLSMTEQDAGPENGKGEGGRNTVWNRMRNRAQSRAQKDKKDKDRDSIGGGTATPGLPVRSASTHSHFETSRTAMVA